jgi:hypothetical protein
MYAANTYKIRIATEDDARSLRRLAELDSQRPLGGDRILVGEIDGAPAAALSLATGRTIADPFKPTAHLVATLRTRAGGLVAVERTPSLRDRLRPLRLDARPLRLDARPTAA